jgi:glycosyltransferase involved in cell wall biosynthesis
MQQRNILNQADLQVEVILPTFNGSRYISLQIESIANQTTMPHRLHVWDDCSTDSTREVLREMALKYGPWLCVYHGEENIGCSAVLNKLISLSSGSYVALCDQDDVWQPYHIEHSLDALQSMESYYGKTIPLLVHSDPSLIDANGRIIADSFWEYSDINPDNTSLTNLSFFNVVTGCTCLLNKALVAKAFPVPECALVHDWWIALVASNTGRIIGSRDHSVLYRQHSSNLVGAKKSGLSRWLRTLFKLPNCSDHLDKLASQQEYLLSVFSTGLTSNSRISCILDYSLRKRLSLLGICSESGWTRSIVLWLAIVLYRK